MALPSVINALLSTRDGYLKNEVARVNRNNSFPTSNIISGCQFFAGDEYLYNDLVISGSNDEERACAIARYVKSLYGRIPIVLLHSGNYYLSDSVFQRLGMKVHNWNIDPLDGLSKTECLSVLTRTEDSYQSDLPIFYSFALDVLNALGMSYSVISLCSIDWTSVNWLEEVAQKCQPYPIRPAYIQRRRATP